MKIFQALCIVVMLGCTFFGVTSLSNATAGVGLLCVAGIAGIFARIDQAEKQHIAIKKHHAELMASNELIRAELNLIKQIQATAHNIDA